MVMLDTKSAYESETTNTKLLLRQYETRDIS